MYDWYVTWIYFTIFESSEKGTERDNLSLSTFWIWKLNNGLVQIWCRCVLLQDRLWSFKFGDFCQKMNKFKEHFDTFLNGIMLRRQKLGLPNINFFYQCLIGNKDWTGFCLRYFYGLNLQKLMLKVQISRFFNHYWILKDILFSLNLFLLNLLIFSK